MIAAVERDRAQPFVRWGEVVYGLTRATQGQRVEGEGEGAEGEGAEGSGWVEMVRVRWLHLSSAGQLSDWISTSQLGPVVVAHRSDLVEPSSGGEHGGAGGGLAGCQWVGPMRTFEPSAEGEDRAAALSWLVSGGVFGSPDSLETDTKVPWSGAPYYSRRYQVTHACSVSYV